MSGDERVSGQPSDELVGVTGSGGGQQNATRAELVARIESLEAEIDRLRRDAAPRARQRYLLGAFVLGLFGLAALSGAVVFPELRAVLLALGGSGVFLSILTRFIAPERSVAAATARQLYGTLAENETAILDDLNFQGTPYVVPASGDAAPARLFIPLKSNGSIPQSIDSIKPFRRDFEGLVLQPTGAPLYDATMAATVALPETLDELSVIVAEALTEQFDLVDEVDAGADSGHATLTVYGSVLGPIDHFNHPVASVFATSLAIEQETPVAVEVAKVDTGDGWLVTCRWDTGTEQSTST